MTEQGKFMSINITEMSVSLISSYIKECISWSTLSSGKTEGREPAWGAKVVYESNPLTSAFVTTRYWQQRALRGLQEREWPVGVQRKGTIWALYTSYPVYASTVQQQGEASRGQTHTSLSQHCFALERRQRHADLVWGHDRGIAKVFRKEAVYYLRKHHSDTPFWSRHSIP